MYELNRSHLLAISALAVSILSACGGGSGSNASDSVDGPTTLFFDSGVEIPANPQPLDERAAAPMLFAIQSQGFETEYDQEYVYAPHQNAWERWDLSSYVNDGTFSETRSCADIAAYQGISNGSGTVTIVNTLQENYVGYVEHHYNSCVIGRRVYSGTQRINIFEEPRDHPSGKPAARFQWEYENYYWGTGGLNYFLDGIISFEELGYNEDLEYAYQSTSNYTFSSRNQYRYSMRELVSRCDDHRNELSNDYDWRCNVQSGYVGLHGIGEYSVKTLQPVYQSVWLWDAKLQISDDEGNHLVFWGDDGQKRATLVDSESHEQTLSVAYNSSDIKKLEDTQTQEPDLVFTTTDTQFKQWHKELYSSDTDEIILFDPDDSRFVDAIRYLDGTERVHRRIDLVEPAYDVNVLFEGDSIVSGHDGATRSIYLKDPELASAHRPIGLGKIIAIHDDFVVTYQVPGSNEQELVSYRWDYTSQTVTSTRNLSYYHDAFAYKNGQFAVGDSEWVEFRYDGVDNYDSKNLRLGRNHGYLKYIDNNLVINGSGALVQCGSRCSEDAAYWKSVNEAIAVKYPDVGPQIVVAAAADTEGLFYTTPQLMVIATKSEADWIPLDNQRNPESADHLWVVDLNDMSRIKKLATPLNDFSVPNVGLEIRELFNRKRDNTIIAIGSWNLASGRENTVIFSIDLDNLSFE